MGLVCFSFLSDSNCHALRKKYYLHQQILTRLQNLFPSTLSKQFTAGMTCFFNIKEKPCDMTPKKVDAEKPPPIWSEMRSMLKNKAFLWLLCIWLAGPTAVFTVQGNLLMFCKYIVGDEDMMTSLIGAVQGLCFAFLPFWIWLAKRKGKRFAYMLATSILSISCFLLTFTSNKAVGYILASCVGSSLIVVYLIPYSMLPDCIEVDELMTGRRREGIYVGCFGFLMKLSVTLSSGGANMALKLTGYEPPALSCGSTEEDAELPSEDNTNDSTKLMLRLLVGVIPAAYFALAMFCCYKYPITKDYYEQVQKDLAIARKEREGKSSEDTENGIVRVSRGSSNEVQLVQRSGSSGVGGISNAVL